MNYCDCGDYCEYCHPEMLMKLYEFKLTFRSGRLVRLYFYAPDTDTAWEQVWTKAKEQGHNPAVISGLEIVES